MVQRRRIFQLIRGLIGPALGALLVLYFGYHTVQGNHGLVARGALQERLLAGQERLSALQARHAQLRRRVEGLMPAHVDPDLVDQQARLMLNYAHPDDFVVLWGQAGGVLGVGTGVPGG